MKHRLAIQHIEIRWTKWDRGADPGTIRNALPRTAPFQPPFDIERGWLHHIRFDADHDYRRDEAWYELGVIEDWRVPIQTRIDADHLWIKPRVASQKPRRPHLEDWIIRLPFGQHAIFHNNGATDGDHQRRYEEHRIAIGFAATATLDLPLFREIDERVLLY